MKNGNAKPPIKIASTPLPLPRVLIEPELLAKIQAYINAAQGEISGLGQIQVHGTDFLVTDIYLLHQIVDPGSTELDRKALADFMEDAMDRDLDLESVKLWWHSHADGLVFWSPTDEDAIANLSNAGWMLSVVGNKRGDYLARLDIYTPVHVRIDIPLKITLPTLPEHLMQRIQDEVEEKVVFVDPEPLPVYAPYYYGGNGGGNNGRHA